MQDWDDLKTFLMIARHHTLSAAARALGVQQPTMGRRLEALEQRAGTRLLTKTPTGYVLTQAGEAVLGHVERIEAETLAVERAIAGTDSRLEGTVRVTAVETLASELLPAILVDLHVAYPGIRVDVLTDPRRLNLAAREADVALRMGQFTQPEVVIRKLGDIGFGVYASAGYVERCGMPDFGNGCEDHRIVTDLDAEDRPETQWLRDAAPRAKVAVAANSRGAQHMMIAAGLGFGCMSRFLGDADPRLVLLPTPRVPPGRELWMGVHEDTRHMPRIRAVTEALSAGLRALQPRLAPRPPTG